MVRSKSSIATEIGLNLPHSKETIQYIKRENFALYLLLIKFAEKDKTNFEDIMILEYSGPNGRYYSCPLCKEHKVFSTAFGHAMRHYESHILEVEDILEKEQENFTESNFY